LNIEIDVLQNSNFRLGNVSFYDLYNGLAHEVKIEIKKGDS
jgi:hypothetical protein